MAPPMPLAAGVSSSSAPRCDENLAALDRHRFRHDQDQAVAARCGDEGKRDAGVAGCRLDEDGLAGLDLALGFERVDQRHADAILDRGQRIEELELQEDVGLDALLGLASRFSRTSGVLPIVSVMLL